MQERYFGGQAGMLKAAAVMGAVPVHFSGEHLYESVTEISDTCQRLITQSGETAA